MIYAQYQAITRLEVRRTISRMLGGNLVYSPVLSSILKITLPVTSCWVVFRLEEAPILCSVIDQMLGDLIRDFLLFLAAGRAIAFQGVGQVLFKFSSVWGASTTIQQTVHVSIEKPLGVDDRIDIDVVVLRRILLLAEDSYEREDERGKNDEDALHLAEFRS